MLSNKFLAMRISKLYSVAKNKDWICLFFFLISFLTPLHSEGLQFPIDPPIPRPPSYIASPEFVDLENKKINKESAPPPPPPSDLKT